MAEVKIFKMNDCDWYAAESPESAERQYQQDLEYSDEDMKLFEIKAVEISTAEYKNLIFTEDDFEKTQKSFRQKLSEMVIDKANFPICFASTEA